MQMVRNAWHMGAKSTTALRVLVTHSDNTRSVECVEDDLGLQMPRDADIILKKLRAQGIDCVSVEGSNGKSVANSPTTTRRKRSGTSGATRRPAAGAPEIFREKGRRLPNKCLRLERVDRPRAAAAAAASFYFQNRPT